MSKHSYARWAALLVALLVGTSAVTTAQDQNTAAPPATPSVVTTDSTPKTAAMTGRDLTVSAATSADHTLLFRALRASGLTDQASGTGPYTVFAPTNEAFDKLPAGLLDDLMKPAARSRLVKMLAYHVVKGKFKATDLQDGQKLKTLTGGMLLVNKRGDTILIVDGAGSRATINQADMEATNGIVHSVDTVLTPAGGQ